MNLDNNLFMYLNLSIPPILPLYNIKRYTIRNYNSYTTTSFLKNRIKGPKTIDVVEPSEFQNQVIIGLMLGDISAERYSLNGNTRLRFYQSSINKEYIQYLYSIFKSYVKTPPKEITRKQSKLTGLVHTDIYFSTLKFSYFNWVREEFYINNIKIVPKSIELNLTPVGLAFWIMDDGSYNKIKSQVILCTDSYTKEEVIFLISILTNKFNFSCGLIDLGKGSYRIRINKRSMPDLIKLVKPYFISSMYYKLGIT